ncbi:MAG: Trp family transcriptional regulator [Candidatus Peribacteraceae bacterium]|jgi:TrpR family trp operon transcriptional repressor|nr:Trp family transcriptional regulator [Candidatus Peribacteraceae bacterium]MDP7454218.1 Trp family transcriptional regulator [Candidatus Peribacteraceae bacterium]|tara:strand:+ start:286 stop:570 length:285 start_codon:yes stop_codon:yes gene_type:complete
MSVPPSHLADLYKLFASVDTEREAEKLLKDILTPQELASIAERWQLVQKLSKGVPQRKISEDLGISISKITRGSRMLQYGGGGFKHFLKKLGKN